MTTDRMTTYYILAQIRNIYLALHRGTDSAPTRFSASTDDVDRIFWRPSSYLTCNVPGHHPDTSHIHDSASPTFPPAVLHDNAAPISAPPAHTPPAPSSFVHSPPFVDENFVDMPLLNNTMSVLTSFYPAHQTAMESPAVLALHQTQWSLVQHKTSKSSQGRHTFSPRIFQGIPLLPAQ